MNGIVTMADLVERLDAVRHDIDPDGGLRWAWLCLGDLLDDCRDLLDQEERPRPPVKTWGEP